MPAVPLWAMTWVVICICFKWVGRIYRELQALCKGWASDAF